MGILTSELGVQQGDPLGPFYFSLVLHQLVTAITSDPTSQNLSFHVWYLDDGVMASSPNAILQVITIIQEKGSPLGLHINLPKCEVFSPDDLSMFPSTMKLSSLPHLTILGAPIGDSSF